jgi:hypothetical protein
MTQDPKALADKVMAEAVNELTAAGCHPNHIRDAMLAEIENLRVLTQIPMSQRLR